VAQQLCESLDTKSSTPSSVGHQTLSFPADTLLGYINLQDTLIFTLSSTASVARSLPEHDGVAGAESEHAAMDHTLTATNPSPLPDPQGQPLTESPEPETKTGFFSRIRAFFSSGNT
jgi:hypothetical protein